MTPVIEKSVMKNIKKMDGIYIVSFVTDLSEIQRG